MPGGAPVSTRPVLTDEERAANVQKRLERRVQVMRSSSKHLQGTPPGKVAVLRGGKIEYLDRGDADAFEAFDDDDDAETKPKKKRARGRGSASRRRSMNRVRCGQRVSCATGTWSG